MDEEIKPGKTYLYVTTMEGKTFKLDAKSKPVEWPSASEQNGDAKVETKTYSATLTFKLGKRMREKMRWVLYGCKTRKEYRKFKKQEIQVPDRGGSRSDRRSQRRASHGTGEDKGHPDRAFTLQGLLPVQKADL